MTTLISTSSHYLLLVDYKEEEEVVAAVMVAVVMAMRPLPRLKTTGATPTAPKRPMTWKTTMTGTVVSTMRTTKMIGMVTGTIGSTTKARTTVKRTSLSMSVKVGKQSRAGSVSAITKLIRRST